MISFKNQIKKLSASGYLRTRSVVSSEKSTEVNLNNKLLTSFLSNDYLGMSKNRSVINEIKKSANIHGIGSGSSPLISGYSKSHHYLEKEIAEYLNAEACLVVNSGYMANLCLMDIFDQQMSVIQDRESHNSIIESSKRDKIKINRYKHLDNTHLEKYLDNRNRDIIFSESVFSMTGDTTNIKEHYRLKKKYNSILFIDDAHGFGIAKSTLENCSIENSCSSFNIKVSNVDAYMGTFGKAIGTLGAFVCGSKDLIDMLVQKGRPYIYSTALPRCIIDATRKSLKILVSNKSRYKKLHRNISYFNQGACKKNITIDLTNGPIKTYMVGDPHSALSIQDKFLKEEILVQAIRYPTVPKGHDKIRITITSDHTKKDIDKLLNTLENIHILVGITGSIAAYKAAQLVSNLKNNGSNVKVIMTKASTSFITERTLESISKNRVLIDASETEESFLHLDVSKWADIILIAPCTANSLNKITNGLSDDLLSTTCLAFKGKIFIAPAMNPNMWNNNILQENLKNISSDKFEIIGPDYGNHACGDIGYGRMSSPEIIIETLSKSMGRGILDGIKILVTAGPTREPIDPVRFISNYSSGKMGYAIAEYARDLGGVVKLISGPVKLPMPEGLLNRAVETSTEMLDEVLNSIDDCDIFISAAAISDYKPLDSFTKKHKSSDGDLNIKLVRGEDILKTAKKKNKNIYAVGFSAETNNIEENAKQKLVNKKIDMIIANEANHIKGVGFESDYNQIVIIDKVETTAIPVNSKKELAKIIINKIASIYKKNLLKLKNAR